jgi:preprotein translocase SecE subunit
MAPDRKPREPGSQSNPGPEPTEPHRENVPGELDHASGEVEDFEAALVSNANGTPDDETSDEELERAAVAATPASARRSVTSPSTEGRRGPRFLVFLQACWAELQRVQWPDRRQVFQATGVVIGFVIVAGAYLGVADWAAQKVVDFII